MDPKGDACEALVSSLVGHLKPDVGGGGEDVAAVAGAALKPPELDVPAPANEKAPIQNCLHLKYAL